VSVNVVCAESDEGALRPARSGALMMLLARQGKATALPSPETAERYDYSPEEAEFVRLWLSNVVYGTPDTVRSGLRDLRDRTAADELMLSSLIHGFDARRTSYELVAREFGRDGTLAVSAS
jgi:alkanesulfonate monooxygenase SsuD/methylene tetrahydromethanopterin reductase-like flavin-dependent oxidoreductase (luciferase family)